MKIALKVLAFLFLAGVVQHCIGDEDDLGDTSLSEDITFIDENAERELGRRKKTCKESGGTVSTQRCCSGTKSFPDTCRIGACGCGPDDSEKTKVCDCPDNKCFNGSKCVKIKKTRREKCKESGGTVSNALCCSGTKNFPDLCGFGTKPCGSCGPENSENTKVCNCPDNKCFNGKRCIKSKELMCEASGGTVDMAECCKSAKDFPNTCAIGACGCSPDNSDLKWVCDCPRKKCFDGKRCVKRTF